ncbi:MAG: hypothetical protein ACLPXZ_15710 [Mycobacterium sp.]
MTTGDDDAHVRRAGDPRDHADERDALRHELGMGAVRSPVPVDVDRLVHEGPGPAPDASVGADGLTDTVAHRAPPVGTHLVEGALLEHARRERERHPQDPGSA